MQREKTLRLRRRLEPTHLPFALLCWLVRYFGTVVHVSARVMWHRRHHLAVRGTVAAQLVGHQSVWLAALPPHKHSQKTLRRTLVASRLDENVDNVAVLIDGAPEILLPAADPYEDLVQVPRISEPRLATFRSGSVSRPELQAPTANGFIRDLDATLGQQIFDITGSSEKTGGRADRVANELRREPMSSIRLGWAAHPRSLPQASLT